MLRLGMNVFPSKYFQSIIQQLGRKKKFKYWIMIKAFLFGNLPSLFFIIHSLMFFILIDRKNKIKTTMVATCKGKPYNQVSGVESDKLLISFFFEFDFSFCYTKSFFKSDFCGHLSSKTLFHSTFRLFRIRFYFFLNSHYIFYHGFRSSVIHTFSW